MDNKQQAYWKPNSYTLKPTVKVSYPGIIWAIKANHPGAFHHKIKNKHPLHKRNKFCLLEGKWTVIDFLCKVGDFPTCASLWYRSPFALITLGASPFPVGSDCGKPT